METNLINDPGGNRAFSENLSIATLSASAFCLA